MLIAGQSAQMTTQTHKPGENKNKGGNPGHGNKEMVLQRAWAPLPDLTPEGLLPQSDPLDVLLRGENVG